MLGRRDRKPNVGVARGEWGEAVAAEYLRRNGYEIIDRNSHPVAKDQRLEIDIVAWDRSADEMVFVEVKQHAKHSPYERRMRSVNRDKRKNLRRACNCWRWMYRWFGAYRFDVLEIYGVPGEIPEIDHIFNVRLFVDHSKFVKWR